MGSLRPSRSAGDLLADKESDNRPPARLRLGSAAGRRAPVGDRHRRGRGRGHERDRGGFRRGRVRPSRGSPPRGRRGRDNYRSPDNGVVSGGATHGRASTAPIALGPPLRRGPGPAAGSTAAGGFRRVRPGRRQSSGRGSGLQRALRRLDGAAAGRRHAGLPATGRVGPAAAPRRLHRAARIHGAHSEKRAGQRRRARRRLLDRGPDRSGLGRQSLLRCARRGDRAGLRPHAGPGRLRPDPARLRLGSAAGRRAAVGDRHRRGRGRGHGRSGWVSARTRTGPSRRWPFHW